MLDNQNTESGKISDLTMNNRDGNLLVVVIVKSCVNKQTGSWLAGQEWTTNQKPDQQVDTTLVNDYN